MCRPKILETIVTAAIATASIAWFSSQILPIETLGGAWSSMNVLNPENIPVSQI
ncbi:MAG: hypothetical protein HC890_15200 [Chloroflexaceae bacterium]|nr:hypothetical protein [Chloroflexaceae bacterium]